MLEQVRSRETGGAAGSDGSGKFPDLVGNSGFFSLFFLSDSCVSQFHAGAAVAAFLSG